MIKITPEEICKMEAGREMDALVAERVMGWKELQWQEAKTTPEIKRYGFVIAGPGYSPPGFYGKGPSGECYLGKSYSTDISAAWEVVEKVGPKCDIRIYPSGTEVCFDVYTNGRVSGWADINEGKAPLAICRAALKAVK